MTIQCTLLLDTSEMEGTTGISLHCPIDPRPGNQPLLTVFFSTTADSSVPTLSQPVPIHQLLLNLTYCVFWVLESEPRDS